MFYYKVLWLLTIETKLVMNFSLYDEKAAFFYIHRAN